MKKHLGMITLVLALLTLFGTAGCHKGVPETKPVPVTDDGQPFPILVKGEPLYLSLNDEHMASLKQELPAEVRIGIDQSGYLRTATLTDESEIKACLDVFLPITIGDRTDEEVTDNYNYISFSWTDGTSYSINLNLKSLDFHRHIYELDNFDGFWKFAQEHVKETE